MLSNNSIQSYDDDDDRFINFESLSTTFVVNKLPSTIMTDEHIDVVVDDDDDDDFVIVQSHCIDDNESSTVKSISNEHEEDIDRDYDDDGDLDDDDDYDEPYDNQPPYFKNQMSILSNKLSGLNRSNYLMNVDFIKKDDDRDSLVGTSASDDELDSTSCHSRMILNSSDAKNKTQSIEMTTKSSIRFCPFNSDKSDDVLIINNNDHDVYKKTAAILTKHCQQQSSSYSQQQQSPPPLTSHSPDTIESSDCDQHYHLDGMDTATTYSTNSSQDNLTSLSPLPPSQNMMMKLSLPPSMTCTDNQSLQSTSSIISSDSSSSKPIIQSINPKFKKNYNPELSDESISSSDHQRQRQSPSYPPSSTLTSIRMAVSHLTRLDDFNVVKLSQGFFSQVFKVIHLPTGKIMVLKMNKNPGNRGNALKEIELLNKLNHQNIVAYMGTVVHEGGLHPLLEYINGGMAYLHSQGYLHRDLASKNIFIRKHICDTDSIGNYKTQFDDERLEAVIGDFGFATGEPTNYEQKLSIVGSPYWLAPECLSNKYNHKCDIFSFGVICCELNWHTPSDPDFLPRLDNYAIDFVKLESSRMNTLLAKIAMMACQYESEKRPEFQELLFIFNHNDDDLVVSAANHKHQSMTNSKRPETIESGFQLLPRVQFKRFNSLDSNLIQFRPNSAESICESQADHLQRRRHSALNRHNSVQSWIAQ
ncbi:Dual specificity testis-specific protein kinase 2, variant 2 [Dermatophagoides farinae]|uniref:dual-specificity kinase n=1 Tax=Dermatophagoides farinae TaxID=6954 RepID=A0A922L8T8_DERFA|nr:Dual specificity testis-specific protein kinase 2, variant 2 [Dermatophagoides farinae]